MFIGSDTFIIDFPFIKFNPIFLIKYPATDLCLFIISSFVKMSPSDPNFLSYSFMRSLSYSTSYSITASSFGFLSITKPLLSPEEIN